MIVETDTRGHQSVAADIAALQAYRDARAEFNARLVDSSVSDDAAISAVLIQETSYQLCEFYYLLRALNMAEPGRFEQLVERHNDYLASLLATPDKMERLGLKKDRVLLSIFDGETRPRLIQQWTDQPGTIDQSNLARFLVAVMSAETTRKLVVAFERAGFMSRDTTRHGAVLVRSKGMVEQIYGEHLRRWRERVAALEKR